MENKEIEILNLKVTIEDDYLEVNADYSPTFEGKKEKELNKLIDNFMNQVSKIIEGKGEE